MYLTKNGEGDLMVMDIKAFSRRERMLKLREELLAVEEDRLAKRAGVTPDELGSYLDSIIDEAGCIMLPGSKEDELGQRLVQF